jgi:hypothetical protein
MLKNVGSLLTPGSQVVTVGEKSPHTHSWCVCARVRACVCVFV